MTYYHRIVDDYIVNPPAFSYFVSYRGREGADKVGHGSFHNRAARDRALVRELVEGGYKIPRWWQLWRDDKRKLPPRIISAIRARERR